MTLPVSDELEREIGEILDHNRTPAGHCAWQGVAWDLYRLLRARDREDEAVRRLCEAVLCLCEEIEQGDDKLKARVPGLVDAVGQILTSRPDP